MITFIVVVTLLGFFLLYITSENAVPGRFFLLEKWAQDHPQSRKYGGMFLFSISWQGWSRVYCLFVKKRGETWGIYLLITLLFSIIAYVGKIHNPVI